MGNKVLILTDSKTHTGKESLFPIAAHLTENPDIDAVYIADRADAQNAGFYRDRNPSFNEFHARRVDAKFSFEHQTVQDYPAQNVTKDDFDAVWIRIDHPVSDDFLRYVRALFADHFIVNDPDGLIETMSKEFLPDLQDVLGDMMPKCALCKTADEAAAVKDQCPNGVVLKQVLSYGGKGVVRWRDHGESELRNKEDVAKYLSENGLCLVMEYLIPPDRQSDRRVVVMNGAVVNVLDRVAKEGGWLCNLTSGATAEIGEVTDREREVALRLDPIMRKHGIFLYGADMLLNNEGQRVLSEVNTLNVGTIAVAEKLTGKPITAFVARNLAKTIHARNVDVAVEGLEILGYTA